MTDYAKWDRFAAEIDSDSDGASEPDIAAPPFSSPSSSEGHEGTDVVHANRRSNANFNSTSTSAASRSDEYGGGGSERDLKYKLLAENLVETLRVKEEATRQLKAKKEECDSVIDVLKFMPTKTRHQVMVPLGEGEGKGKPLAFQEGELVHTNEMLMKLDDVLVERTPDQAMDVLKRRSEALGKEVEEAEKGIASLQNSLRFASAAASQGDFIDIREDYESESEEEEEKEKREVRRPQRPKKEVVTDQEFEDMMKKLEHFESLEIDADPGSTSGVPQDNEQNRKKKETKLVSSSSQGGKGSKGSSSSTTDSSGPGRRKEAFTGSVAERVGIARAKETAVDKKKIEPPNSNNRPVSHFKMSLKK